jgi:uncharacterized protein YndB with AHSA1/START domain
MTDVSTPLVINHWIATTPQEVFTAYTTPELLHQWFSPEGLSIPLDTVVIEPRVGGRFECTMIEEATGVRHENVGHYLEFEPPHRLVGGEQLLVGGNDMPDFRSVQEFTVEGDGTRIHIEQYGLPAEFVGNPMVIEAFRSSYRKLGRLLGVETQERDCA